MFGVNLQVYVARCQPTTIKYQTSANGHPPHLMHHNRCPAILKPLWP